MSGIVLDAGALIAHERRSRTVAILLNQAHERGAALTVPAGVIGQVWRDGRRQARVAHLLAEDLVTIVDLDEFGARAAGQLCGLSGTADVIDASVVVCAQRLDAVVLTSDPDDLRRLDPTLKLVVV